MRPWAVARRWPPTSSCARSNGPALLLAAGSPPDYLRQPPICGRSRSGPDVTEPKLQLPSKPTVCVMWGTAEAATPTPSAAARPRGSSCLMTPLSPITRDTMAPGIRPGPKTSCGTSPSGKGAVHPTLAHSPHEVCSDRGAGSSRARRGEPVTDLPRFWRDCFQQNESQLVDGEAGLIRSALEIWPTQVEIVHFKKNCRQLPLCRVRNRGRGFLRAGKGATI